MHSCASEPLAIYVLDSLQVTYQLTVPVEEADVAWLQQDLASVEFWAPSSWSVGPAIKRRRFSSGGLGERGFSRTFSRETTRKQRTQAVVDAATAIASSFAARLNKGA